MLRGFPEVLGLPLPPAAVFTEPSDPDRLPNFDPVRLTRVEGLGFSSIGIAPVLQDEEGRILMVEHAANPARGLKGGEWSVPAETIKARGRAPTRQVELTIQTIVRGLWEETGADLHVAQQQGAKLLLEHTTAIGYLDLAASGDDVPPSKQRAFCLAVLLGGNQDLTDYLKTAIEPSDEHPTVAFVHSDELDHLPLRPGTSAGLALVETMRSHGRRDRPTQMYCSEPQVTAGWQDLQLSPRL
jgi:hypothetical protein